MDRRIFSKMGLSTLLIPFLPSTLSKGKKLKNVFVHHVYFWLKDPNSAADKAKLVEGLQTLTAIKKLKSYHIGIPAPTNRGVIDNTYAISWLLFFDSGEDEAYYQQDPIHLDFVKNYNHLWSKVVVYDSIDLK